LYAKRATVVLSVLSRLRCQEPEEWGTAECA